MHDFLEVGQHFDFGERFRFLTWHLNNLAGATRTC
jgi:hypothetical protein